MMASPPFSMLSMILCMLSLTLKYHQIGWIIIPFISINVMYYFSRLQRSSKHPFSSPSVSCMYSYNGMVTVDFFSFSSAAAIKKSDVDIFFSLQYNRIVEDKGGKIFTLRLPSLASLFLYVIFVYTLFREMIDHGLNGASYVISNPFNRSGRICCVECHYSSVVNLHCFFFFL